MITINQNKTGYEVALLEHGIHQANDPATGLPFASEARAAEWEAATLAGIESERAATAAARAADAPNMLAESKAAKIAAIRSYFGGKVAGLKADAAPYEVETWSVQTAEYSAWAANNATPTPYVSALAAARGMPLAALMGKIGFKVAGLASIQGAQQALEDVVKAATTEAEVDAVVL